MVAFFTTKPWFEAVGVSTVIVKTSVALPPVTFITTPVVVMLNVPLVAVIEVALMVVLFIEVELTDENLPVVAITVAALTVVALAVVAFEVVELANVVKTFAMVRVLAVRIELTDAEPMTRDVELITELMVELPTLAADEVYWPLVEELPVLRPSMFTFAEAELFDTLTESK